LTALLFVEQLYQASTVEQAIHNTPSLCLGLMIRCCIT